MIIKNVMLVILGALLGFLIGRYIVNKNKKKNENANPDFISFETVSLKPITVKAAHIMDEMLISCNVIKEGIKEDLAVEILKKLLDDKLIKFYEIDNKLIAELKVIKE